MNNPHQERISEIEQSLAKKTSFLQEIQSKIQSTKEKSSLWNLNSRAQNIEMDIHILQTELHSISGISFDECERKMQ